MSVLIIAAGVRGGWESFERGREVVGRRMCPVNKIFYSHSSSSNLSKPAAAPLSVSISGHISGVEHDKQYLDESYLVE